MPRVRESHREEEKTERKSNGWGELAKRQTKLAKIKEEMANKVYDFYLTEAQPEATIQFLQDEPYCFDAHNLKKRGGGFEVVPCNLIDSKHCVMCTDGIKQTWRAAFKILDYRGSWDKDKGKFTYDKPVERLWKVGQGVATQLRKIVDKKGKELTEMVLDVSRSGAGTSTVYNFEQAVDDDDRRVKPMDWAEKLPSAEEACQPLTEEELDEIDYIV